MSVDLDKLEADLALIWGRVAQIDSDTDEAMRRIEAQARTSQSTEGLRAVVERVSNLTVEGKDHTQFAAAFPVFAGLVEEARQALTETKKGGGQ